MSEVNSIAWLANMHGLCATHYIPVDVGGKIHNEPLRKNENTWYDKDGWRLSYSQNHSFFDEHAIEIDYSPLEEQEKEYTAESLQKNREEDKPSEKYSKYFRSVEGLTEIDVYHVHNLFGIDDHSGAIQHASKKLLLSGVRTGGKSKYQDIKEARDTLTRWLEMNEEPK